MCFSYTNPNTSIVEKQRYLHVEGGGVGFDVVIRSDARENLIAQAEGGVLRRHKRPHLRHDLQQCDLTQVCRLSALHIHNTQ